MSAELAATSTGLNARLEVLRDRMAEIDRRLHEELPADSEEQAEELEVLDALPGLEAQASREMGEILAALRRIQHGSYGICAKCGNAIAPARLAAQPTARLCITCAR